MIKEYKTSLIIAVVLHCVLLTLLIVNWHLSPKPTLKAAAPSQVQIVEAVSIDQNKLEAEIAKLKAADNKKKQQEAARVKRLQRQAEAAKREKQQQAKKLAELKKKQQAKEQQAKKQLEKLAAEKKAKQRELDQLAKKKQQAKQAQKKEQQRLAALEKKRQAANLAAKKAEQEKLRKQEQLRMEQQLAEEQNMMNAAKKKQQQLTQIERYTALITHTIGKHWIVPGSASDNTNCVLNIKLAPSGEVLRVSVERSSGDAALDRSAMAAVWKASPLPVPGEPELFNQFREIRLLVKPEGFLG